MRNASTNKIATTGEIFENGNILEVLFDNRNRRLSLGLWNGEELKIGPRFEYRGHVYEPASIDSERLRALRFPMNISSPESTPKLLEEVATIVQCYSGLPPTYATLTAYFRASNVGSRCYPYCTMVFVPVHGNNGERPVALHFGLPVSTLLEPDGSHSSEPFLTSLEMATNASSATSKAYRCHAANSLGHTETQYSHSARKPFTGYVRCRRYFH
jgi:hypothetical protein